MESCGLLFISITFHAFQKKKNVSKMCTQKINFLSLKLRYDEILNFEVMLQMIQKTLIYQKNAFAQNKLKKIVKE
jgi:hypothetical protein